MTIKDFGARVESVWEGLRPMTKKMIERALEETTGSAPTTPPQKFSYDAHADWELSRLLSALDEQSKSKEQTEEKLREIKQLAETCALVLQTKTESAEVFIQLAARAFKRNDYKRIDRLADILTERFSVPEIAEIVRQTEMAQIRAVAFEALAIMPIPALVPLLEDSLYFDIVRNAIEIQAFDYESEEAREVLDQMEFDEN